MSSCQDITADRLSASPARMRGALKDCNRCRHATSHHVDYLHGEQMSDSRYQNRIEVLQGTLDLIVLQTLSWGEMHGYAITQAIRAGSSECFQVETGSLYPALHRLERQGWLKAEWRMTELNQRAKYYSLTRQGRKHLAKERTRWQQFSSALDQLLTYSLRESNT